MLDNINFKHDIQLGDASGKMDSAFISVYGGNMTGAEALDSIRDVVNEAIKKAVENNVMWIFEDIVQ